MTNRNDDKGVVISAVGTEVEYLQSIGATSSNVMSAWMEIFSANGATSSNFNDAAAQFLIGLGYSGDLPSMWAAYWAAGGGGGVYDPPMMTYGGGYYQKLNGTISNNFLTSMVRINRAPFTGGGLERIVQDYYGPLPRLHILIGASDHATPALRNKIIVASWNTSSVQIMNLVSINDIADSTDHFVFISFNATTGAAMFYIDGVDADDTGNASRVAPTTGTLGSGSVGAITIGATNVGTAPYGGSAGYVGHTQTYLTNPTDFYDPITGLQELDTTTWTEFGSQPLIYAEDGKCDTNNLGSLGALTKTGTVDGPFGGTPFTAGMMTFDGTTAYYSKTYNETSNLVSCVGKINLSSFTGGGSNRIVHVGVATFRILAGVSASDNATPESRNKMFIQTWNAAGTLPLCRLYTNVEVADGQDHTFVYAFDATNGTAVFYLDGVNTIDTGHPSYVAPTVGTLETNANMNCFIAADISAANKYSGKIGYFGYHNVYRSNPTDFYHPTNGLQEIDETTWTQWGTQPLFWNTYAKMTDNKGSAGNMVANGTITGPA